LPVLSHSLQLHLSLSLIASMRVVSTTSCQTLTCILLSPVTMKGCQTQMKAWRN
jgi:hypothetical protein